MKLFYKKHIRKGVVLGMGTILIGLSLISMGCSSSTSQNTLLNKDDFNVEKSFSFKNDGSKWQADFKKNEITALYKDGKRLPDNQIDQHKELIYKKLGEIRSDYKDVEKNVHRFHLDIDKFNDKMNEFKRDFDNDKYMHFKLEFDEDEFEKNMEKLQEQLERLKNKKIELYFDSDKLKKNMKKLEENLNNVPVPPDPPDVDVDVYLDMDRFKDGMENFMESFKKFDIKIDSSDFDMGELRENMKKLKKNLMGLKIELYDKKGELKKFNLFLDDLKSALIADGYLDSYDEEYNLEINSEKTIVNGIEVKQQDHSKYKELYKNRFDKEIEGTIKIKKD